MQSIFLSYDIIFIYGYEGGIFDDYDTRHWRDENDVGVLGRK